MGCSSCRKSRGTKKPAVKKASTNVRVILKKK
jgi:hypothetical protein